MGEDWAHRVVDPMKSARTAQREDANLRMQMRSLPMDLGEASNR